MIVDKANVCDICKDVLAREKCVRCNKDLCSADITNGRRCGTKLRIRMSLDNDEYERTDLVIIYCSPCAYEMKTLLFRNKNEEEKKVKERFKNNILAKVSEDIKQFEVINKL